MADEEKKEAENFFTEENIIIIIIGFIVVSSFANYDAIFNFIIPPSPLWEFLIAVDVYFIITFAIINIFFILIMSRYVIGMNRLSKRIREKERMEREIPISKESQLKNRWSELQTLINSESKNDWKVAVMNGDILLEEVLRDKGVQGDTLGEMLKTLTVADLSSINDAWDAHKIRNDVAHRLDEKFTKELAAEAIKKINIVFKELGVI